MGRWGMWQVDDKEGGKAAVVLKPGEIKNKKGDGVEGFFERAVDLRFFPKSQSARLVVSW